MTEYSDQNNEILLLHRIKTNLGFEPSILTERTRFGVGNTFERSIDTNHYIPDGTALKFFRRLREQPPYLSEFVVPSVNRILDVFYYPII